MKPLLIFALSAGAIALAQPNAHAASISYQLINSTELSFDYSLQLANMQGRHPHMPSYLGKRVPADMSVAPIIGPGQRSAWQSYQLATWQQSDGVAFNMITPDGRRYGMTSTLSGHSCSISRNWDGTNVMFVLARHGRDKRLKLVEYIPDGGTCSFDITEGYGPTLWDGSAPVRRASRGSTAAPW